MGFKGCLFGLAVTQQTPLSSMMQELSGTLLCGGRDVLRMQVRHLSGTEYFSSFILVILPKPCVWTHFMPRCAAAQSSLLTPWSSSCSSHYQFQQCCWRSSYFVPYSTRNPIPAYPDHGHLLPCCLYFCAELRAALCQQLPQWEELERYSTFCQLCFTVAAQNNWAGPKTRTQAWLLFGELSGV